MSNRSIYQNDTMLNAFSFLIVILRSCSQNVVKQDLKKCCIFEV